MTDITKADIAIEQSYESEFWVPTPVISIAHNNIIVSTDE